MLTIEIVVTAKIKLLPTPEQATQLDNTLNAVRDGLNHASKIAYNNNLLSGFKKLQKLVYTELRNTFGLKSQMACNVCSVVAGNYASMKANGERTLAVYKKPKLQYLDESRAIVCGVLLLVRSFLQFLCNQTLIESCQTNHKAFCWLQLPAK